MNRWWLLVMAIGLIVACGQRDVAGGSTVETENAFSVFLVDSTGKPLVNVEANARPAWFVAATSANDTSGNLVWVLHSDVHGRIDLSSLPNGAYGLEILGGKVAAFLSVGVTDSVVETDRDTLVLGNYGRIVGNVDLPPGAGFAWIQIYGLDRVVQTDAAGNFVFDSLPPGDLHFRAVTDNAPDIIAEVIIPVAAGVSDSVGTLPAPSLAAEDLATWKFHRKMTVGSLISEWMLPMESTAMGFVRLDSTDTLWEGASTNGSDLRIADADGNRMVFGVALWDSLHGQAVVRVRLDGMDLDDSLTLYWGKPGTLNAQSTELWAGVPDSSRLEWYSLDVADFEAKSMLSNLPAPISRHYLYLVEQDTNVRTVPLPNDAVEGIVLADSGRAGNAYHLQTTSTLGHWGLLGIKLDTIPKNLSHLDSIVYWVRGSGKYSVGLESLVDYGGKTLYNDTLSSQWTRKCLRPQDFVPGDSVGGNIGWELVRYRITNLSFFAKGNSDFWLDDIRIYGWNRDDLK